MVERAPWSGRPHVCRPGVVCHSVNSAHGPTTATLNETNVAGVVGDARVVQVCNGHQSLRAHGIRAPSGAGRGGAVGRAWGWRGVLGQLVTAVAQRNCAGRSQRAAPAAGPCHDAPARVAVTYAPMASMPTPPETTDLGRTPPNLLYIFITPTIPNQVNCAKENLKTV